MASTASPYGLLPIQKLGGGVQNHALRQMKIASGYNTNIFYGDIVKRVAGGTIEKDTGTTTATPVGVFLGVQYTDATYGFTTRQMWTAGTAVADAYALVCDDPDALFQIQSDEAVGQTGQGCNAAIVQGSGSTANGKSGVKLDGSTLNTTSTLPLRIVDFVQSTTSTIGDAYTDLVVKFNNHQYTTATGLATS